MPNHFLKFEIGKGIFHIKGCMDAFVTLFIGEKCALLLDADYGVWDLAGYIKSLTQLPLTVVNSHGHIDHINGNYQFDEVYLSPPDFGAANEHSAPDWKQRIIRLARGRNVLPRNFDADKFIKSGTGNILPLTQKSFDLGGITLDVINTPGHTHGCTSLLCREERLLFTGDAANGNEYLFLPDSTSISNYIAMLQRMDKLDFDRMVFSHYYAPIPKSRIQNYIHCAQNIDESRCTDARIKILPHLSPVKYTDDIPMEPSGYPDDKRIGQVDNKYASIYINKNYRQEIL